MRAAFVTLLSALGVTACAGISTSVDWDPSYDFGRVATYAWVEQAPEDGVSETMLRRLHATVGDALSARGYDEATADAADILLAYHAGVQDRRRYDTYGYGSGGWWDGYWGGGMTTTTVRSYAEGTLILDLIDRASNQLVWRGSASTPIDETAGPEQRATDIEEAARRVLRDFPPR